MRFARCSLLLAAGLVCVAQSSDHATVVIEVWDEADQRWDDSSVELVELGTGKTIGEFRKGRAENIPFGEYTLNVERQGFKSYERRLGIYSSEVFVMVHLQVANMGFARFTLMGTVRPALGSEWIRIMPVVNGSHGEARLRQDGSFSIGSVESGDYFLLVMRGSRAVLTKQLVIRQDTRVELEIPVAVPE